MQASSLLRVHVRRRRAAPNALLFFHLRSKVPNSPPITSYQMRMSALGRERLGGKLRPEAVKALKQAAMRRDTDH
jgi:hypothetical protein